MISKHWKRNVILLAAVLLAASLPVWGSSRIERTFALGSGGELIVDTDIGGVTVVGGSGSEVKVLITSRNDDIESDFEFDFSESPGRLEIRVEKKGSKIGKWFGWTKGGGLKFEIEVPADTHVDIDTAGGGIRVESIDGGARLDTSGGGIQVQSVRGDVDADTSGGGIEIEDVDGDVVADTSGGGIEVHGVRGSVSADTSGGGIHISEIDGDIDADTSGGGIEITGAGGAVRADTSGGPVDVAFTRGNSSGGSLSSSGGGVRVRLDPAASLEIDASSSGGSVVSNIEVAVRGKVSRNSLHGRIGGGGATLKLRSSAGSIRIEPL